jgi:hypothetical protein
MKKIWFSFLSLYCVPKERGSPLSRYRDLMSILDEEKKQVIGGKCSQMGQMRQAKLASAQLLLKPLFIVTTDSVVRAAGSEAHLVRCTVKYVGQRQHELCSFLSICIFFLDGFHHAKNISTLEQLCILRRK